MFKNKYKNPWANDLNQKKPEFYENNAPVVLEHRGVKVYKLWEKSFDFVFNGVCITQRSGASKAKEIIDSLLNGEVPVSEQVKKIFPNLKSYSDF